MNRIALVSIIIGVIGVSFAGFYVVVEMKPLSIPEDTNFTLYVSNQSVNDRLVNIKVRIDDNLEIDQDFDVGYQHQIYPFYFKLSQGEHIVQIDAKDASHQREFTIDSELWMAVAYWHDKDESPMILVDVSDGPTGFQ